ncbi:hypothetical protein Tco_0920295 [Tanacetum coccineum]
MIVGESRDLRGIQGFSVSRSLPCRESQGRGENVDFDLTNSYLFPSFIEGHTPKGVGFVSLGVDPFRARRGGLRAESEDTIIPNGYPELLSKDNRWDKRTFKDKIPPSISETLMYQCLARHPASVQSIMNPIMFRAGLKASWEHSLRHPVIFFAFRNFMFAEDDEEMTFLPRVPTPAFGDSSGSVAERMKSQKCKTKGFAKPPIKHKLVHDGSSSRSTRKKSSPAPMETKAELVNVLRQKIKSLLDEVNEHKSSIDKMLLESQKWAGYQENLATLESKVAALEAEKGKLEAVHSYEMAILVRRFVSSAIFYGRCAALEEKEHTNAGNNFVAATFPFISEVVADHSASVEALFSKEPKSLCRPTVTKTNAPAPSQKATPSSAPTPKPMSPPSTV